MPPPTLRELGATFLRLGATAYGGWGMLAYIEKEVVERRGWISLQEFREGMALAQAVPGPAVVNTVAFVGYRLRGGAGAIVAAGTFVLPALVIMTGLSAAYFRYGELAWVRRLFHGLGALVVAILAQACVSLAPKTVQGWPGVLIAGAAFAAMQRRVNFLLILAGAAGLGCALSRRGEAPGLARPPTPPVARGAGRIGLAGLGGLLALTAGLALVDPSLARLDAALMKVSLLAFGGGYTAIALMQQEVVERLAWGPTREFIDGIALGQITPGPVFITATFLGYKVAGLLGALAATVSAFLPSFTLVLCLIPSYGRLTAHRGVQRMIHGVLAAFMGILLSVLSRFAREALVDPGTWVLMAAAWIALWRRVDLLWVVGAGAAASLLVF